MRLIGESNCFKNTERPSNYLASLLKKWKSVVDNKKSFSVLLTDLSKAF